MRTPLVVLTGCDPTAMDAASLGLLWDIPRAVSVQHRIDPEAQLLTRVVSDASGVLERAEVRLEHACVTCALREDIVPTLERLAREERWEGIVASLPAAASAAQLGSLLARDTRLARHLRLATVVAVVEGGSAVDDLLGDDLLRERGVHHRPDDGRGLGEVACHLVEHADVVALSTDAAPEAADLVTALARPDALVVRGTEHLAGSLVTVPRHDQAGTDAWVSVAMDAEVPPLPGGSAWRLLLASPRPFHPDRLLEGIERLGTGPHRTRGCFWLPTRPDDVQQWDGAGGQLSVGRWAPWGRRTPATRLLFTGLGEAPRDLPVAFEQLLVSPREALLDERSWSVAEDGLEPWLGPVRRAA